MPKVAGRLSDQAFCSLTEVLTWHTAAQASTKDSGLPSQSSQA